MPDREELRYLFLLCSERSGSNLITRILDAHSLICGPSPTHLGSDLLCNLHRYGDLSGAQGRAFIDDFLELFDAKMGRWQQRFTKDELLQILEQDHALGAYCHVYKAEARAHDKPVIFIKENRLYEFAPLLAPLMPQSRFLYFARDPRDMALSWKSAPAIRGGVVRAARTWLRDQKGFVRLRSQLEAVSGQSVPFLSYERLLQEPEITLASLLQAFGLEYEPCMLKFNESEESRSRASAVFEWGHLSSPLLRENAGKYRDELSQDEVRYVEAVCHHEMQALGYELEYERPSKDDFQVLHERLVALEPWEKPAYQKLPEAQRLKRKRQHEAFLRIRQRPYRIDKS